MHCTYKNCGSEHCLLREHGGLDQCNIRKALSIVGGKRAIPVMVCMRQPKRFGQLKREIDDISEKMLIQTLRQLEHHKLIKRKDYKTIPPKVEYSLLKKGEQILEIVPTLIAFGKSM